AVESDIGGLEAFHEAGVADTGIAAGGVETHDPQRTHVALLLATGDVGMLPSVLDSFLRVAEELRFVAERAFGVFQHFLSALTRRGGVSCTSHVISFFDLVGGGSA